MELCLAAMGSQSKRQELVSAAWREVAVSPKDIGWVQWEPLLNAPAWNAFTEARAACWTL